MSGLNRRLDKLEQQTGRNRVLVFADFGEAAEDVIARRIEADPKLAGAEFLILRWQEP